MVTKTAKFILDAENRASKGFNEFRRDMKIHRQRSCNPETLGRARDPG